MANAFTTLQTVFKTYLKKQKHFEKKSQTRVVIYRGVLPVESNCGNYGNGEVSAVI